MTKENRIMLEQEATSSHVQSAVTATGEQQGTQLEGIRQKVFMDRYSLKDPSGQPLEHYPEQLWKRVARGIASVEKTDEKKADWEKRFYDILNNFQFVPGGRILAGAGSGHEVTYYNCFSADTLVHTSEGQIPIGTLQGEHEVLSEGGIYRKAFFKSYGQQQLWQVTLANGTMIYATAEHQWVVTKAKGGTERVFTRELAGRRIPVNARPTPAYNGDFAQGVQHGIVYGDGSTQYGEAHVCLFGEKEQLAQWFSSHTQKESGGTVATKEYIRIQALPAAWKQLPDTHESAAYWRGFVAGLIATNGHVDERGSVAIYSKNAGELGQIAEHMAIAGLVASSIAMTRKLSPFDGEEKPVYRLQLFKATLNERDILHPKHLENFLHAPRARTATIKVESVKETDRFEEVFCCVEPETHTITVSHGYLTGQCYVIPSPEDSRQGILDNLKVMTEIMARGGGVGINLSTLRPRGSYIKTVNGTASGPCSWAQLYSVATGDVIQQGGSRRGALMLMLDDNHPDIEEFITVKRTPGKIEHANLSVCVSDAFMQAVKDDADWNLIWQGEVRKTIRARELWDLICKSAWESAEPGVVFMNRYNKESNTWYYEDIRCVNPCVTGDTLIYTDHGLIPAAELATSGLPVTVVSPNIFVKELVPAGHTDEEGNSQFTKISPTRKVSLRPASHVFPTGIKPVYRLQTKEGYSVRLTGDHKVLTVQGWKAAQDLIPGDKIHLLHGEGGFGTSGSLDLGQVLGWLVGDGYLNKQHQPEKSCVTLSFFGSEQTIAPHFAEAVNRLVSVPEVNQRKRDYHVSIQKITDREETRVESVRLMRLIDPALLDNKLQVPPSVLRGSRDMQQGFLSALFSADGSIQGTPQKGFSVRLTSISQELLEGVQRLLLSFGVVSNIVRNRRMPATRSLPDGKGGLAAYNCQAYHDLIISSSNLRPFAERIGFLVPEKQQKLEAALQTFSRGPYREDFLATFENLSSDGEEMVYDLVEPEMHLFTANGLIVHNCGEQGLPPWGVCNLGAINLSSFVQNGRFDYERLAETSKVAMRFLDNVIDANLYFIEENREAQMGTRRTGLGTMGLADALIKMKIAYGSAESVPVIERIYTTIRDAAYEASADIAVEKGVFPRFERDKYMQGRFIKRLSKATQEKIKKQGIRNAVLLTQAPTGTTSLLAGVSSGIEPVYDFAMVRRDRTGEHILYHPLLEEWRDKHPEEPTPDYFVASNDLAPEEHVRVQATIQRYTDSSISKTVNAPNNHTVEQVEKLYRLAYEEGCKGVTYYRDGSRDAVLTRVEDERKAAQAQQPSIMEPVTSIHQGTKPVPEMLQGYTRHVNAPEGKVNITINSDEHGPFEVFVNVGKAGSDISALAEALGRVISLNLRILSPLSQTDRAQEIADQLRGIGGSRSVGFGMQQVRSLPDAVARALDMHMEMLEAKKNADPSSEQEVSSANGNGNGNEYKNGHSENAENAAPTNFSRLNVTGNLCPRCGCNTLVYEEGCRKCYSCGHSEC
jgi:ribonucleoside-diphosphate reductase alpha chain